MFFRKLEDLLAPYLEFVALDFLRSRQVHLPDPHGGFFLQARIV
jgi:hypothetical protein